MSKELKVSVINDLSIAIQEIIDDVRFCSPATKEMIDPRVAAIIVTKLEEAQLWATRILKVQP